MNAHKPMQLISLVTTDLVAVTRGRSVAYGLSRLEALSRGCGWVPANSALHPLNAIAPDNPWGSHGDLRLLPDMDSRARVVISADGSSPPFEFIQGNLVETDGTPWSVCPRTLLQNELKRYQDELGLSVTAAFEHEFTLLGLTHQPLAFSLQAQRQAAVAGYLMAALDEAGAEPEMFLPEYGEHQYEVTCRPTQGIKAADRAVIVREVTREMARQCGLRSSFSPLLKTDGTSNGVHLHISLYDQQGQSALYQPNADNNLSKLGEHWAAGVLRHLPALCALTAPSVISWLRLKPHRWSAAYGCLGNRNREAALRICPTTTLGGANPAQQFNLEYRPMDATACPHLAMAAVLMAGRLGIAEQLPLTALSDNDPANLTDEQRKQRGIRALPRDLPDALTDLQMDSALCAELPRPLLDTWFALRGEELRLTQGLSDRELCERYAQFY